MRNSESPSVSNGPIVRDIVYDVNIPGNKEIKVIVNLEAQLDPNPGYPLMLEQQTISEGVLANRNLRL